MLCSNIACNFNDQLLFCYRKMFRPVILSKIKHSFFMTHNPTFSLLCFFLFIVLGAFEHGKMHGEGTLTWPNGTIFTGDFVQNEIKGKG